MWAFATVAGIFCVAFCVYCLVAKPLNRLLAELMTKFLGLSPLDKSVIVGALAISTVCAQKNGTNDVVIAEGETNVVEIVDGDATNAPTMMLTTAMLFSGTQPQTVTPEDIARGWQLWEVRTNCNVCYTMPEGATLATNWWVRGAYEDVKPIDFGSWRFPFGTNEYDSVWAFSWGKLRFALGDVEREIAAVGAPMSAVPYRSRLWSAADTNGARVVAWENFALGRLRTDSLCSEAEGIPLLHSVNAQVELRRNGDFIARSNDVETVYRRVDPEDWDGDGWRNDDDYNPYGWDDCNDDFYQELPDGADPNAYCWIEVRPEWNTWIDFQGDDWSYLPDPNFTARAGKTYRVWLLIGKTYSVHASMPVSVVGRSDERIDVTDVAENSFTAVWPVTFTVAEGRAPGSRPRLGATWNDGGKSFYVMPNPSWLRGAVTWTDNYCCDVWGDGTNFTYACDNTCTCEGCTVYGRYWYEGYGLPVWGISCGCRYIEDHGPTVMSLTFDKSAAIFEDEYTNMPGVVVHPTPSNVVLRCEVYGGTYGGRLTVALNEAGRRKIARVSGNALPNNVLIQPDTTRVFETVYTPLVPSDSENDIEAVATFVEDFTHDAYAPQTATMTSVKVELETVYEARDNQDKHRHVYGVAEGVKYRTIPASLVSDWQFVAGTNGVATYGWGGDNVFVCPWTTNGLQNGRFVGLLTIGGASYQFKLSLVEPQVEALYPAVNLESTYVNPVVGEAGHLLMYLQMFVKPYYVSFKGVQIIEIPDESQGGAHWGYYDDRQKGGNWSHTEDDGAGIWNAVSDFGFYAVDRAGRPGPYALPWQNGMKTWAIPMGWGSGGNTIMGHFRPNPTTQVFSMSEEGTFTIRKFNHEATRTIQGYIWCE